VARDRLWCGVRHGRLLDPNWTSKARRFLIARKPETHLFSTETCSMASCRGRLRTRINTRVRSKFSIGSTVANPRMYDHIQSLVSPSGLSIGPTHMPKFLRIGAHQSNVSGCTSKAWWVVADWPEASVRCVATTRPESEGEADIQDSSTDAL
jgi:hypothetical protein